MIEVIKIFKKYAFKETLLNHVTSSLETEKYVAILFCSDRYEDGLKIRDSINKLKNYAASFENGRLSIFTVDFTAVSGTRYLRIGRLPENEESYNFLTKEHENGVSVFELNGETPILNNLQLIDSFSGRHELPAFIVTGERVGTGFDGEPLLKNVSYVEKINLDFKTITEAALTQSFKCKEIEPNTNAKEMYRFFTKGYLEVIYGSFSYSEPIEGFDTEMGKFRNEQ